MIQLTWQSIITAGAVLGALTAIITLIVRFVRWVDRQKAQDVELQSLRTKHDGDLDAFRAEHALQTKEIKEEQTILTYGILACLKGLKEQGCNGPVTEAIGRIEKHLNEKAHE